MNVAVIINGQAGYANRTLIESSVRQALFRCRLRFLLPINAQEMQKIIIEQAKTADVLLICGGDGTLNTAIHPLMVARQYIDRFPPICALPVGTANDLARELGISQTSIQNAARLVLEGQIKAIDVLEVEGDGNKAYMITNGGVGVAAETAKMVNHLRSYVISRAECEFTRPAARPIFSTGKKLIKSMGPRIYELTLASQLITWSRDQWFVDLEIDGHQTFSTHAPFVMVNNQRGLGANYTPAPLTYNADGTFNLLLLHAEKLTKQVQALWKIKQGLIPDERMVKSFETKQCTIRAKPGSKPLTFFGDGEILHENVSQINVTCLSAELPVYIKAAL